MLVGGRKARRRESIEGQCWCAVASTKGKLEVLKTHYRHLGSCRVDSAFDDSWREEVDEQVS